MGFNIWGCPRREPPRVAFSGPEPAAWRYFEHDHGRIGPFYECTCWICQYLASKSPGLRASFSAFGVR